MSEGGDDDKDSKTEEPTQKKLEDAVKKGQVVNSKEVTSFLMFLLLTLVTIWLLPSSMILLGNKLRFFVENAGTITMDQGAFGILVPNVIKNTLVYLSPIFIIVFIERLASKNERLPS